MYLTVFVTFFLLVALAITVGFGTGGRVFITLLYTVAELHPKANFENIEQEFLRRSSKLAINTFRIVSKIFPIFLFKTPKNSTPEMKDAYTEYKNSLPKDMLLHRRTLYEMLFVFEQIGELLKYTGENNEDCWQININKANGLYNKVESLKAKAAERKKEKQFGKAITVPAKR